LVTALDNSPVFLLHLLSGTAQNHPCILLNPELPPVFAIVFFLNADYQHIKFRKTKELSGVALRLQI